MASRFHASYTRITLQRAQGRLAAARRALPWEHQLAAQPDDDLGDRPLEVPVLKRPAEAPARRPDDVEPPLPNHVPLPSRSPVGVSLHA